MLPITYRLRKHDDFQRLYREGKTLRTPFFRIITKKNSVEYSRFAVVISNKIIKRAVMRNKKRRQIRALLRELFPHIKTGYDIAIVAQPPLVSAEYSAIEEDLRAGFQKIGFFTQ